jgi:hypothetical protein
MNLLVTSRGVARCAYGELIDLTSLGDVTLCRASRVEPDEGGHWHADLSAVGGPRLGPFRRRSAAIEAETRWLDEHWLSVRG